MATGGQLLGVRGRSSSAYAACSRNCAVPQSQRRRNTRINHASLRGFGWRRKAAELIAAKLDEIFPGHSISASDIVGDLSIGRRQMSRWRAPSRSPRIGSTSSSSTSRHRR